MLRFSLNCVVAGGAASELPEAIRRPLQHRPSRKAHCKLSKNVMQCNRWTLACASVSTSLKPERTASGPAAQHKSDPEICAPRSASLEGPQRARPRSAVASDKSRELNPPPCNALRIRPCPGSFRGSAARCVLGGDGRRFFQFRNLVVLSTV